jgi:hypothetical protein
MGYYMGDFVAMRRMRQGVGHYGMFRSVPRGIVQGDPFFGGLVSLVRSGVNIVKSGVFSKLGGLVKHGHVLPGGSEGMVGRAGGLIKKHPVLTGAGAAGAIGAAGLGHHLLAGHKRKHRRMNVYNPRALRRAVRRAHGFAKMARRVLHIEKRFKHPKRWGHMGHFTKKKKRA